MMTVKFLLGPVLILSLSACGVRSAEEVQAEADANALADAKPEGSSPPANGVAVDTTNLLGPPPQSDVQIRSAYTDLATARCKVIDRETEGQGSVQQCAGYGGVPLYVKEGDLRTSMDAGALSKDFATMGPFNTPAGPVEWRLDGDGRPFAIIYRLRAADGAAGPRTTTIFVKSVGQDGKPGCTVAEIPGATPDANLVARKKADAVLTGASCLTT